MQTPGQTYGDEKANKNFHGGVPNAPLGKGALYAGFWVEGLRQGQGAFVDWDDGTTFEVCISSDFARTIHFFPRRTSRCVSLKSF